MSGPSGDRDQAGGRTRCATCWHRSSRRTQKSMPLSAPPCPGAEDVAGSRGRTSNHSWGTAVDISVGGILDGVQTQSARLDGKTLAGLAAMAPFFNQAGWYWGAGFSTFEDGMHFEVGGRDDPQMAGRGEIGAGDGEPDGDRAQSVGRRPRRRGPPTAGKAVGAGLRHHAGWHLSRR